MNHYHLLPTDIEILVATTNYKVFSNQPLLDMAKEHRMLIINQIDSDDISTTLKIPDYKNIRIIHTKETGLAKSRNFALKNAIGNICVLADDDIEYTKDFFNIIKNAYKQNQNADILTFQQANKPGSNKNREHNIFSIAKVISIEITFKRKSIQNQIYFNEDFGLGSIYQSGEENLFLIECIKKGYKAKAINEVFVLHPAVSSGSIFSAKLFHSKGALFKAMYGKIGFFILLYFLIKKYTHYKKTLSFLKAFNISYKSYVNYKN